MYPVVMLLGQLLVAVLAALALGWALGLLLPGWLAYLLGLGVVWPVLEGFRRVDGKFFVHYLLLDFAFTAKHKGRNPPELEARLDEFAALIAAALADPELDEVLVVGHSSGVHLGRVCAGTGDLGGRAAGQAGLSVAGPCGAHAILPAAGRGVAR